MKRLITAIVALIIVTTTLAGPAMAYMAVVTTSVAVASTADEAQLGRAVDTAVADVLAHAIAFVPTRMTLEGVRVIGDRIYLILLMADEEGERVAGRDEPRPVVARTAASEPGAQAAGACLPPLHRGVRNGRSHRRQKSLLASLR